MNLQLQSAEEIFEGKTPELLGEVLIRFDLIKEASFICFLFLNYVFLKLFLYFKLFSFSGAIMFYI